MSNTKALDIVNLHAGYGETEILKGINLRVEHSEIVAIIGPNGAGKSTVVKSVLGLLNIISGNISLNGNNIVGIAPDKAIKSGISYVPQTHNIFPNLTITENLEMGAWTKSKGIPERIQEMFELFPDLKVKRNKVAGSLSGGQRQMVAMAKALMVDSKIMLLDEPGAGVNPTLMQKIGDMIIDLNQNRGYTFCLIEHDMELIERLCHRIIVLAEGRILQEGSMEEIRNNSKVVDAYFGSADN